MKHLLYASVIVIVTAITARAQPPVQLQCGYLFNPIGIDDMQPRLAWRGVAQSAHHILVAKDTAFSQLVWNTTVNGGANRIIYNGKKLEPFTRYYWKVIALDKQRKPSTSATAFFETGMMESKNWKGAWIQDTRNVDLKPAPYFRKSFSTARKIVAARAYIAAAGLYELSINGERIGDHYLDPMYTRFDRRILYLTYDVTAQIRQGENAIGVLLGNGWYNHQSTAVWYFDKAPWRNRPSFCMDLRITYADGSVETVSTGKDWKTVLSPVIFNSIYTAEHYDANKEIAGWNKAGFIDTAWKEISFVHAPAEKIIAQSLHPIRLTDTLPALPALAVYGDTGALYKFEKNMSGITSVTVQGKKGTVVRVKHGERLYKNGRLDMSNIDVHYRPTDNTDPFQTDIYILKGGAPETFMPHFNYKGFQFVEILASQPVAITNVTAYFMHSDVPPVGNITSSNEVINSIWAITNQSYLSNLFGYPTDCPQREKNGWTGDAQTIIETGLYNFDAITVYEKWMADHRDEQQPNGVLPSIIPTSGWGYEWGNGPDWTSTIAMIPWNLYLFYGDSTSLFDCYENIKRYVDHIDGLYPSGLCTWGLGDWIPIKSKSPVELTSTCYYYADVSILAKAAKLFGKADDHKKYTAVAEKVKAAFNKKYFKQSQFIYNNGLQTELSVALYWGLVPDQFKAKVAASLAKRVLSDSTKLDVGLLGTKAILTALSDNGYPDIAFKLATATEFPSWGFWVKNGLTALPENWPLDAGSDISMNHVMFGEISAWFYKALGGIRPDPAQPGFKNILLRPHFAAGLDSFTATHTGPYGEIVSSWKRTGRQIKYTVTIPPNSTATMVVGATTRQLQQGSHTFTLTD